MASFNIFDNDAFTQQSLILGIQDSQYKPGMLGSMGIFTNKPIRTEVFSIERRGEKLELVKTSPRGAPLSQGTPNKRTLRHFGTHRLGKSDTIRASEFANVRAFGSESEIQSVQTEVATRFASIQDDLDLSLEKQMLGAVQGILVDSDGTVLEDYFAEWGVTRDAKTGFDLSNLAQDKGLFQNKVRAMLRKMVKKSNGSMTAKSGVTALCSESFYGALLLLPEVREIYRNRDRAFQVDGGGLFDSFFLYGITWIDHRGLDQSTELDIPTDECIFIPTNARDMFLQVLSPGESFADVGTLGQEWYPDIIRDLERDQWVKTEVSTYRTFLCSQPQVLQRGKIAA